MIYNPARPWFPTLRNHQHCIRHSKCGLDRTQKTCHQQLKTPHTSNEIVFPPSCISVRLEVPNSPTENKGEILHIGHIDICQHLSSSSAHLYPFFGIPKYPFHSTPPHSSPLSQLHQNHPRLPFLNNNPILRSLTPSVHTLPPFPFSNPSTTTLSYPSTQSLFYFGILHRCFYSFSVHSIITLTLFPTYVQTLIPPPIPPGCVLEKPAGNLPNPRKPHPAPTLA